MRKIVIAMMSTISGLVLLFSYHTSTDSQAATTASGTEPDQASGSASTTPNSGATSSPSGSASATPSASSSATSGSPSSSSSSTLKDGTYTGDEASTRWGEVQVKIIVKNGKVVSADAVEYPSENHRDQEINSYAIPELNAEVVAAQSAKIDAVSGATVTSGGYLESLQSAIDAAHHG